MKERDVRTDEFTATCLTVAKVQVLCKANGGNRVERGKGNQDANVATALVKRHAKLAVELLAAGHRAVAALGGAVGVLQVAHADALDVRVGPLRARHAGRRGELGQLSVGASDVQAVQHVGNDRRDDKADRVDVVEEGRVERAAHLVRRRQDTARERHDDDEERNKQAGQVGVCTERRNHRAQRADVFCCDILPSPSQPEWEALQQKAKRYGVLLTYGQLDICDGKGVQDCFASFAASARRRVVGVAHCAGVMDEQEAMEYDMTAFARVMRINVDGTMNVAKAAAQQMRAHGRGGSIVLIASISGTITNRGITTTAYSSSKKAACHQMCRSLAVEWGRYGIRVSTISPGYIRTAMTASLLASRTDLLERWEDDNPLQRIGNPWELKGAAVYLLSKASSFNSGSDIRINGGHCSW